MPRCCPRWSVTEDRLGYHHTVTQTMHSAAPGGRDRGAAASHDGQPGHERRPVGHDDAEEVDLVRPQATHRVVMRAFDDEQ